MPRTPRVLLDQAEALRRENPRRTCAQIARIIAKANDSRGPSQSTVERHLRRLGLSRAALLGEREAFGRFGPHRAIALLLRPSRQQPWDPGPRSVDKKGAARSLTGGVTVVGGVGGVAGAGWSLVAVRAGRPAAGWAAVGIAELGGGWGSVVGVGGRGPRRSGPERVDRVECALEDVAVAEAGGGRRITRRPVRTIRAGIVNRRLRSVLAARRSGALVGALPEAPAAGHRSQHRAVRLSASSALVSHTRLACSSPEGRWRSACPSLLSFNRSSICARWW